MTESEAIKILEKEKAYMDSHGGDMQSKALGTAISALEEVQQYRAIGTVEELKSMKENGSFSGLELAQIAAKLNKLKEYEAIGTVSEFRELKEKATEIRAKAITEFVEQIKARAYSKEYNVWGKDTMISIWESVIDDIASEMKGESR